jgi:hypothetical protein
MTSAKIDVIRLRVVMAARKFEGKSTAGMPLSVVNNASSAAIPLVLLIDPRS